MKKFTLIIGIGLIVIHLLSEAHSVLYLLRPDIANQNANGWFVRAQTFYIAVEWWLKMYTDQLLLCMTYFMMAAIAYRYSVRLFLIIFLYALYHTLDTYLLLFNWKQGFAKYYVLLAFTIAATILLLIPEKKKSIFRSME